MQYSDRPDLPAGRLWIDPVDARVLRLAGEVDHAVVAPARAALTHHDLVAIDVIDMADATFIDSAVIALLATIIMERPDGAEPLAIRSASEFALVVLEVAGLLPMLGVID